MYHVYVLSAIEEKKTKYLNCYFIERCSSQQQSIKISVGRILLAIWSCLTFFTYTTTEKKNNIFSEQMGESNKNFNKKKKSRNRNKLPKRHTEKQ